MKYFELELELANFKKANSPIEDISLNCAGTFACVNIVLSKILSLAEIQDLAQNLADWLDVEVLIFSVNLSDVCMAINVSVEFAENEKIHKQDFFKHGPAIIPRTFEEEVIPPNLGFKPYRFKENPSERKIAKLFNEKFGIFEDVNQSDAEITRLQKKKAAILGPSKEDCVIPLQIEAISATIQWLATPVGQSFLRDVLDEDTVLKKNLI